MKEFGGFFAVSRRLPPLLGGFRARFAGWWRGARDAEPFPAWLRPEFERALHLRERWKELQRPVPPAHPVRPLYYASLSGAYWPSLLEGEDAGVSRVPVEVRTPFLDLRLIRFLLRVPPVPWCVDKKLLRVAMQGALPPEILERGKTPLVGDPLLAHVRQKRWSPLPLPPPAGGIEELVDWSRLRSSLEDPSLERVWLDFRALSLNYWLTSTVASNIRTLVEDLHEAAGPAAPEKAVPDAEADRLR